MANNVHAIAVTLPLKTARQIIAGAREEGRKRELNPLTVVVLDAGGHPVAAEREDGSGIARFEVAFGKAWGALGIGVSSRTVGERIEGRAAFQAALPAATGGRCVPVPGGVLVLDGERRIIGAVGISGDTSDADEACALAGIEAAGLTTG